MGIICEEVDSDLTYYDKLLKENEELKRINKQLNETCDELDKEHTRILLKWQKLDKALDIVCEELKNHNIQFANSHIGICTEHCEKLDDIYITQTKEDIKEYVLEQARKELESEKD